ncbi:MAG: hypothetical protein ACT4OM_10240 [Actinomycetota bacterium]
MSTTTLPDIEAEQVSLPGVERGAAPWQPAEDRNCTIETLASPHCSGQLSLSGEQPVLPEHPPSAHQLPLLADPPPWEMAPVSKHRPRPRRPPKARIPTLSEGQMTLF